MQGDHFWYGFLTYKIWNSNNKAIKRLHGLKTKRFGLCNFVDRTSYGLTDEFEARASAEKPDKAEH